MPGRITRRGLLRGALGAVALSPFVPYLDSEVEADGAPTRLFLLLTSEAPIYSRWVPRSLDGARDTTRFELGETSAPLEPHLADLVMLSGVNKRPGRTEIQGGQHDEAFAQAWTGSKLAPGDLRTSNGVYAGWGTGISVDQYVASRLAPTTRYRTLELGVNCATHDPGTRSIYSGPGAPIQPRTDPYAVFDELFADVGGETSEQTQRRAERRSVIDLVLSNLASIKRRVGVADQRKIDAHLEHVRAIEQRLTGTGTSCEAPLIDGGTLDHHDGASANVPALFDLQMDMAVLALACNLTQIVSLQVGKALSDYAPVWLGISEGAHDIGHYDWRETPESLAMRDQCAALDTWRHEKFARLVATARDHGILESSLIVWNQELGQTNSHNMNPTPFVLAGQANGRLRTGRFIEYGDGDSQAQLRCAGPLSEDSCIGEPHPKLLVDICRLMGPDLPGLGDVATFGDTTMYDGEGGLPGLA